MVFGGLDIGSRTAKIVVLKDDTICYQRVIETGQDPMRTAHELIGKRSFERLYATGYGRHLATQELADAVITEIKASALGAERLFPGCRGIIDVGGQDSKVIVVDGRGNFVDFEMNDRCAAGTGRFLEVVSGTLGFGVEELGLRALEADRAVRITSMCTVFSESEVVSLIARGEDAKRIALGLNHSVAERIAAMALRMRLEKDIVLIGGVARNPCLRHLLNQKLGTELLVPENPQTVVALGAALEAEKALR